VNKKRNVLTKVGWVLSSPGILVTLVIGIFTILGIPFFETNLSKTASQEIALGILGIMGVLLVIVFCTLTPIWVLTKYVKISSTSNSILSTLIAILLANLIPISLLGYGLFLQKKESDQIRMGKFIEIEFESIEDAIREFDKRDFKAPPIMDAKGALLYALNLKEIREGIENGHKLGYKLWTASAISYDLLPVEERGGKIPLPVPYRIKIKSLGPIVPSTEAKFWVHGDGKIIGYTEFQSFK